MIVSLIGYRATGKSTVGRCLAQRMACDFVDSDAEIVRLASKSIAQIFAEDGESVFRDWESQVIQDLVPQAGREMVLALGGGAVLREQNRAWIQQAGPVVWLRARAETIWRRMSGDPHSADQRPKLTSQGGLDEIVQLLAARTPIYQATATMEVEVDERTPAEVAAIIFQHLDGQGDPHR